MNPIKSIVLLTLLCFTAAVQAQNTEWLHVYSGVPQNGQLRSLYVGANEKGLDKDNNFYVSNIAGNPPPATTNKYDFEYITKYSTFGDSLKSIEVPGRVHGIHVGENSIHVLAITRGAVLQIDSQTYSLAPNQYKCFVLKYDTALRLVHAIDFADSLYDLLSRHPGTIEVDSKNNIIVSFMARRHVAIDGKQFDSLSGSQVGIIVAASLRDDPNLHVNWVHAWQPQNSVVDYAALQVMLLNNDHVRLAISGETGLFWDQTPVALPFPCVGYYELDENGVKVSEWKAETRGMNNPYISFSSSGRFFVHFYIRQNQQVYYDSFPLMSTQYNAVNYLFYYNPNGSLAKVLHSDTLGKTFNEVDGYLHVGHFIEQQGFLYAIMQTQSTKGNFGGMDVTNAHPSKPFNIRFLKLDTLGNSIWNLVLSTHTTLGLNFRIDQYSNVYLAGTATDSLMLPDTAVGAINGSNVKWWVAKLGAIGIYRGEVKFGPYCAGDSIQIPFTLRGEFAPNNEFIAELSDENGDFFGGHRELGRLQGNQDDTVYGILPLLQVPSSPHYRIRLRSTFPQAQSYYRRDTLRLLIYSKDSANAGNDTLLCRGQTIQLNTSGGSRWAWSPAAFLNDSTLKKPIASPKESTLFRIIISDSSGCGDIDTDYVYIAMREPLQVDSIAVAKDSFCYGETAQLRAYGSGGDSATHRWEWWNKQAMLSENDSLQFPLLQNETLEVILSDACTVEPDTGSVSLAIRPRLQLQALADSLCFDDSLRFTALASGGLASQYRYTWMLGADTLSLSSKAAAWADTVIRPSVSLSDGCSIDTVWSSVAAQPKPKFELHLADSIGCVPLLVRATLQPLNKMLYRADWDLSGKADTGLQPQFLLTDAGNYTLHLRVNETYDCPVSAQAVPAIYAERAPVAAFESFPKWIDMNAPVFEPKNQSSSDALKFEWYTSAGDFSTRQNPRFVFRDTGYYEVTLLAYSKLGCLDSTSQRIRVDDLYSIAIPNAFTPNRDGLNALFEPVLSGFNQYRLIIYNRWGEQLFDAENQGWDGRYRDTQVPSGVYYYRIDVKTGRGDRYFYNGTLTVLY